MFERTFFQGEPTFRHGEIPRLGVLLAFLGTPAAPTAAALRPYLGEFLSDKRVIELWQPAWKLILNGIILRTRPKKSAEAYEEVWTDEGSPLLLITERQTQGIETRLREQIEQPLHVAFGATYGHPSMASALEKLRAEGCRRIVFLPLFPQYSSTSSGAAFDAFARALMDLRWVPEVRTIMQYHDDPRYIALLADRVRARWADGGQPDKLVMSFHGIPQRYLENGDLYHCQCHKTGRLVGEALDLHPEQYQVTFQSLFGREEWIKPYTDRTLEAMARAGVQQVDAMCPGFSADCLETLEEIEGENREIFEENGGSRFRYIPCLNDAPDHLDFLASLIRENMAGWLPADGGWDRAQAEAESAASRTRAQTLMACPARANAGYSTAK
ncbi:MAG: ferrochelatase [Acidobacteriota bacterium]